MAFACGPPVRPSSGRRNITIRRPRNERIAEQCRSADDVGEGVDRSLPSVTRRQLLWSLVGAAAANGALGAASLRAARAFCSDVDVPFWAHYVDWNEGTVEVDGKRLAYVRLVGNEKRERKNKTLPLLVIPDAGLPHDYLENLTFLAEDNRRVVFVDTLGSGHSTRDVQGSAESLRDTGVKDIMAVLDTIGIRRMHVYAHGFGASIAVRLAKQSQNTASNGAGASVASLVLESPVLSRSSGLEAPPVDSLLGVDAEPNACARAAYETVNDAALRAVYAPSVAWSVENDLAGVSQPLLLLCGQKDELSSNASKLPWRQPPNVHSLPTQHAPLLERQSDVLSIIRTYLLEMEKGTKDLNSPQKKRK